MKHRLRKRPYRVHLALWVDYCRLAIAFINASFVLCVKYLREWSSNKRSKLFVTEFNARRISQIIITIVVTLVRTVPSAKFICCYCRNHWWDCHVTRTHTHRNAMIQPKYGQITWKSGKVGYSRHFFAFSTTATLLQVQTSSKFITQ